jgi:hypothetical protein
MAKNDIYQGKKTRWIDIHLVFISQM